MRVGAIYRGEGHCDFRLFAPEAEDVKVVFPGRDGAAHPMARKYMGYWGLRLDDVAPGETYYFRLGQGPERPDPASASQPDGVHGPSQVWDHGAFRWSDAAWNGHPIDEYIIYEIHIGTFTMEGTFDSAISILPHLVALGVNAVEIMPVNQFPGDRNWGYDGSHLYAVQNSYGGPDALKRLVDACHAAGISVILDVVYNHLGPEGTYLQEFGPYFTQHYKTPWGSAINFEGPLSSAVRDYFIENALYWFREYHIDALRLDAVHQLYDMSALHILEEMSERVREFSRRHGRERYLIAESDLNDPRILRDPGAGGYGLHSQWLDDFQHCVDSMLRKKESPYFQDFGEPFQFLKVCTEGFAYSGEYCPSRQKHFGRSSADRPPRQFVVFAQNHDQVGNRPLGERLSSILGFEATKLAAGAMLLSPYIPLLFMGEEYGEKSPFLFFADFSDHALVEAVREGRKKEFDFLKVAGKIPSPEELETFHSSRLDWTHKEGGKHKDLLAFYTALIHLRRSSPALRRLERTGMEMSCTNYGFFMRRRSQANGEEAPDQVFAMLNFDDFPVIIAAHVEDGAWELVMDSSDERWGGPGSTAPSVTGPGENIQIPAHTFLVYRRRIK